MPARASLILWVLLSLPATAVAELSAEAHVFSEVVHRGVSLTDGEPAIGASMSWDSSSGWFVGGGGFYADDSPWGASRTRNWHAFVGWFHELDDGRALELSAVRSQFVDLSNWSYTELRGNYHWSPELSLSLAWSPDYYGRDAESLILAGNWQPDLSDSIYVLFSGGVGYLAGTRDTNMLYGQLGIGYRPGRFDVSLSLNAVDSETESIFMTDATTVALRFSYLLL